MGVRPISDRGDVDDLTKEFLIESGEGLDCMERCLNDLQAGADNGVGLAEIFRAVHTIKGTVGFLGFPRLERLAHAGEALLARLRDGKCSISGDTVDLLMQLTDRFRSVLELIESKGHEGRREADKDTELLEMLKQAATATPSSTRQTVGAVNGREKAVNTVETTVRVEVETLNRLMNLVGELVQTRNQFLKAEVSEESFTRLGQRLDSVTANFRETVMQARMQPVGQLFQRFPRLAREVAATCGKSVRLEFIGGETGLDKSLLEMLKDPLAHAVRNAIDHGIEAPEIRFPRGKPVEGKIQLRAFHEGGQIVVEVKDDGAGIDDEKVVQRAVERGLITPDRGRAMGHADAMELLFEPGFSTNDEVTLISGRGVGLDVVRENVERVGGTVELESILGEGTTLRMRVPLTLAIVPAMIARCGEQMFAVPHSTLLEMVVVHTREKAAVIQSIGNARMFLLRDRLVPLLDLSEVLGIGCDQANGFYIAILEAKGRRFGLIVDDIADPQEIVVKPLSRALNGLTAYSGATILGDGQTALILDTTSLARSARLCDAREHAVEDVKGRVEAMSPHPGDAARVPMLVFANHRRERSVVPLACVERIEKVSPEAIETLAGRGVMQYLDELVELEDAGELLQKQGHEGESEARFVLICRKPVDRGARVGLVVRDVLDIAEGEVLPAMALRHGKAARVNGRLAIFCAGFEALKEAA